jgi:uncharacterized OsmC-like protein
MHTSETTYLGKLRTENIHIRSGQKIITDAPVDNNGKGEAFSPTDLVATALCDCILTIAGMMAAQHGFSIDGAKAKTEKTMSQNPPRKISGINIEFDFSMCDLNGKQKMLIEKIPAICPVSLSLHPEINQNINFIF